MRNLVVQKRLATRVYLSTDAEDGVNDLLGKASFSEIFQQFLKEKGRDLSQVGRIMSSCHRNVLSFDDL